MNEALQELERLEQKFEKLDALILQPGDKAGVVFLTAPEPVEYFDKNGEKRVCPGVITVMLKDGTRRALWCHGVSLESRLVKGEEVVTWNDDGTPGEIVTRGPVVPGETAIIERKADKPNRYGGHTVVYVVRRFPPTEATLALIAGSVVPSPDNDEEAARAEFEAEQAAQPETTSAQLGADEPWPDDLLA